MKKSIFLASVFLVISTILTFTAHAYESGDIIVRAGPANVNPDESSGLISLGGTDLAGTEVNVAGDTQLGITITYMLSEHIGIGLLASTPFEHDISENGVGVGKVGTAKQLPPTLSAQYYPLDATSRLQPYVGVGLNYTTFFSEKTSSEIDGALGNGKLSLDDSFGLALEIGTDYALNDNWSLNASVWLIDLDTDATIETPAGKVEVDVEIDPLVTMIGLAYTF